MCGHSFCNRCTQQLCVEAETESRGIKCPVCRQSTELSLYGMYDLPPNYSLNTLLERLYRCVKNKNELVEMNFTNCEFAANDLDDSSYITSRISSISLLSDKDSNSHDCFCKILPENKNCDCKLQHSFQLLSSAPELDYDLISILKEKSKDGEIVYQMIQQRFADMHEIIVELDSLSMGKQSEKVSFEMLQQRDNSNGNTLDEIYLVSDHEIRYDLCKVCDKVLSPPVKFLTCGHSYCSKCVNNLYFQEGFILCLHCGRKSMVPELGIHNLPTNFALHKFLERLEKDISEDQLSTTPYGTGTADNFSYLHNEGAHETSTSFISATEWNIPRVVAQVIVNPPLQTSENISYGFPFAVIPLDYLNANSPSFALSYLSDEYSSTAYYQNIQPSPVQFHEYESVSDNYDSISDLGLLSLVNEDTGENMFEICQKQLPDFTKSLMELNSLSMGKENAQISFKIYQQDGASDDETYLES